MSYAFAHREHRYRRTLDGAFVLAVLLHMAGFLIVFEKKSVPPPPPPKPIKVVSVEYEPIIPKEPVEINRPKAPPLDPVPTILTCMDADPQQTIQDTEIDIHDPRPVRLDGPPAGATVVFREWTEEPQIKRIVRPEYPDLARQAGIEGIVRARVEIDEKGRVTGVEIIDSPSVVFDGPAIEALFRFEFYPARQHDRPVSCSLIVPLRFTLREADSELWW